MQLYVDLAKETTPYDIENIVIKEMPERNIYIGPTLDDEVGANYAEASLSFYDFATNQNQNLNCPFGILISKECLLKNDGNYITCYFLMVPNAGNSIRPAGRYVIGHMHGSYGEASPLYEKLLKYIQEHHLIICGNAYEEYPFNEMTHEEEGEYLIRVMVQIK